MNRPSPLLKLLLVSSLLIFLLTLLDTLPLHDIFKDYVSPFVLADLNLDLSAQLPGWTAASMEWRILQVSFLLKIALAALNSVLAVVLLKRRSQN